MRRELDEERLKAPGLDTGERVQPFGIVYRPDLHMRAIATFRLFCLERPIGPLRHFPARTG